MKKLHMEAFSTRTAQAGGRVVCVCLSESKTKLHRTHEGRLDLTLRIFKGFICWLIYNAHSVVHLLFSPLRRKKEEASEYLL